MRLERMGVVRITDDPFEIERYKGEGYEEATETEVATAKVKAPKENKDDNKATMP